MRFFGTIPFFIGMALSQSIEIGLPAPNQRLSKGANVTVQIQRPNNQSGSKEMAVAIGIYSCPTSECFTPDETMGTILYVGSFDPKYHEFNLPPYQNFTVKLPSDLGAVNKVPEYLFVPLSVDISGRFLGFTQSLS
ncbi:hypothetical protein POX_f08074 [Penicillium oxalicum]|uniref:hypothetical protein n=1 Tax=Penicillium oxalicum TaxID=69781 RepID=UPI0020B6C121|nr:hypothetical protein POX_f08074 [Penicillium oxalicum]KAI2787699.1 hypothetical protein POX_f08074 [Penicillium oxalicum]